MSLNSFQPDEELKRRATEKLRKMLVFKSFMERWEPIATELKWVIGGSPDAERHCKILPEYCCQILELYRRTTFKLNAV